MNPPPDAFPAASFSPAPVLSGRQIDLWLVYYQAINDADLLSELTLLLSPDERQRQARFHFPDDRKRFLLTRAAVRTVLSRYAPVAPVDWVFTANEYGRPAIAELHRQAMGLSFNLSHANGLIALGVCHNRALGVDSENLATRPASPGIAERFFAHAEVVALNSLPESERHLRFFELWTFKEAYIKARGKGLSIPLDRFSFSFADPAGIAFHLAPLWEDSAQGWQFWQFRPTPDYLLALCAERRPQASPGITLRTLVPTRDEALLCLFPSRTSKPAQED